MEQVPEEVAEVAIKYQFPWSSKSFQNDVTDLHRKVKVELVKKMKLKEGCLRIQVSVVGDRIYIYSIIFIEAFKGS